MTAFILTEAVLSSLKKALRQAYPNIRSSHLTEAIAAAFGWRTHASMRAQLKTTKNDPPILSFDSPRLLQRLDELGNPGTVSAPFETLKIGGMILTEDPHGRDIHYKSDRELAWRNLMVHAVNSAIQQGLISLRPGDNRWYQPEDSGHLFDCDLPTGLPARCYLGDIGFGELSVRIAVNPKGDFVRAANAGLHAGDAFAAGWLERERGAWLQSSTTEFNCRTALLSSLASMGGEPVGFGDKGRVIS